jgi:hypothetical protein
VLSIRHGTALVLAALALAVTASAEENPALIETLQILRDRGMIDDAKHAELVAKNQAWEASHPSLLSRLEWAGDFRGRLENFWYSEDGFGETDPDTQDRSRGRYRLRIGARAKVNEVVRAGFRLASGENDHRSTNQSFGRENDFAPDAIWIDQAYVELSMPQRFLPEGMRLGSIIGKQANPFLWKNGKDFMIWDQDITPEGVALQVGGPATEALSLYGNAGYFVVDENSGAKDPHVLGIQGGFDLFPADCFDFGARVSFYDWNSVNDAFLTRTSETGSLIFGTSDYSVVELATYGRITTFEQWPILIYGHIAQNLEADSPAGLDDEDLGWGAGVEIGDKKRFVMVGGGYYHVEANFSPAQFTDSDLFDGFTNREGFLIYLARELFPNTELNLTLFSGDEIESAPAFDIGAATGADVPSAERYRLQTDLVVKF